VRSKPDLRLHTPFEELVAFANNKEGELGFDMPNLSLQNQNHVPCVVILIQLKEQWKAEHDGRLPSNFKEKEEFKKFIKDYSRKIYPAGTELAYQLTENFSEAVKKAMLMYSENHDDDTLDVLNDPRCD